MATNYPGSLDSGTQQPSPSATTEMDDSGFEHDVVHTNHSGAIIALETKVGTGDSNAVADSVLAGTGSGTSGWTTGTLANAISGNAATATALATARAINGVDFDGSAAITVTAAAGTLTGATLASGVTASSLTSVGTLASLTVTGDATFDTSTLHVDSTSNRVGIGTTTPNEALEVAGQMLVGTSGDITPDAAGNGQIMINANGYTGFMAADATGIWVGSNSGSRSTILATNETARLTVTGAGKVGIGTTTPSDLLDVGDGSTAGSFRVHANGGSESFRVSGNVVRANNIVNLTTSNAANVFINSSNGSMYRSTSSIKYKTDVETIEDEYADRVLEMRPVWYRSITGNDPTGYSYYGLIAEEVAAIDPRLVSFGPLPDCICGDDPDDEGVTLHTPECLSEPEGVQYDRLVPHLISVVQRQAAQIGQLLVRVDTLETV